MTLQNLMNMKAYTQKDLLKKIEMLALAGRVSKNDTWDEKEYGLVREIVTMATALKKMMETSFLKDENFLGVQIHDLGKELTKEYKNVFDAKRFLEAAKTNLTVPKDFESRFTQTVVRATRAPFEGEDVKTKTISIIDDLKSVLPAQQLDKVDVLKVENTFRSDKPSLKYVKIKK